MWRPFASNFVNHAFDNFLKQPAQTTNSKSHTHRKMNSLFSANLREVAEMREIKFKELTKHMQKQKTRIKKKDQTSRQKQSLEVEKKRMVQANQLEQKKIYYKHLRSFTTNRYSLQTPGTLFSIHDTANLPYSPEQKGENGFLLPEIFRKPKLAD